MTTFQASIAEILKLTAPCGKQSTLSPQLHITTASCGCSHVTQAVNVPFGILVHW